MTLQRDMSRSDFAAALVRYGMRESGFMGYVRLNIPGHHQEVSKLNAGPRRRAQLAYLLSKQEHETRECRNCGRIFADHFKMAKDEKGQSVVLRPCPGNATEQFA